MKELFDSLKHVGMDVRGLKLLDTCFVFDMLSRNKKLPEGKYGITSFNVEELLKVGHRLHKLKHKLREFVKKGDFELGFDASQELNSLWELYKHDFSLGSRSRKLIFITWSIKILTSKIDWKLKLIEREELFFHAISNVNLMIQKIKPDEVNKGIYQDQKFKIMIQNNYLSPEKKNQMIDEERRKIMEKQKQNRIKEAKKKKISINSLDKLEQLKKMDKYANF